MVCPMLACAATLKEVPVDEALNRRFPEEIAFITYQKGDAPGITVTGNSHVHGVVSLRKTDYAHEVISETGEFVISYPGGDMEEEVLYCFANKGERGEAFQRLGLETSPGKHVNAPLLEKCIVNCECKVKGKADAGDSTIFLGEIVRTYRTGRAERRLFIAGYEDGRPVLKAFAGARGVPAPPGHEKYPEQTVMVVSCDENGRPNAMTAGWTFIASEQPPMVAVAIGKARFTHSRLERVKEFVYVYPGQDMTHEMLYCGTKSGRDVDKFKALNLDTQPARKVKPPLLTKAVACFECTVAKELDYGSHTLFVGQIEAAHVSEKTVPRVYNLGAGEDGHRVFRGLGGPE